MKKICVVVGDDGQISVGVEPQGEEMAEGEGMGEMGEPGAEMGEDESYLQPVADEREALMKVRELMQAQEDPEASAGFEKGFNGVSGAEGLMA